LFLLAMLSVASLEYSIVRSHPDQLIPSFVLSASEAAPLGNALHSTANQPDLVRVGLPAPTEPTLPSLESVAPPPSVLVNHARRPHHRMLADAERSSKHPDNAPSGELAAESSSTAVPAATVLGGLAAQPPF
jgi:hypothetical protein